ncbi:glycosyltransferase family 4 protein [Chloroflexota bacterium]
MSDKSKLNLCIITFPMQNHVPLIRLIRTLESLASGLTLITGNFPHDSVSNDVNVIRINHDFKQQTMFIRIPKYIITQLKIMFQLIKARNEIDIVIYFIGGFGLSLPILASKLLRKKIILSMAGSGARSAKCIYKNTLWGAGAVLFPHVISLFESLNLRMSNRIVVYSPSFISFCRLEKFRGKISIAHEHFLDFGTYRIEKALAERNDLIGYVGRLSEEKGVINFVKAIPKVLKTNRKTRFLIIGRGPLRSEIEGFIKGNGLERQVRMLDWIHSDKIPVYLNRLKLLVLPSYTEGLPNIALEAMACGTVVLTTPVGSIPDLVNEGETGFILENNNPESIAIGILRAMSHPRLDAIADKAHQLVEQNYTYEAAVAGYKKVLASVKAE